MRQCCFLFLLAATSCGGGSEPDTSSVAQPIVVPPVATSQQSAPPAAPSPNPTSEAPQNLAASSVGWTYGPTINGVNRSAGTWLSDENGGFAVNIPSPNGQAGTANYITRSTNGLSEAKAVYIDFEVIAAPGTKLKPRDGSDFPSLLTLYFQRAGDNWYADASTETYRWWASPKMVINLEPGKRYTVRHRFDEVWTAVLSSSSESNPNGFAQARAYANQVGFTLGGGDGLGHGVFATAPAKILVHEFRVE